MDLKKLLLAHFTRNPTMQIQDMVKLIYQNEFAGGHLIDNEADSLMRLREECGTYYHKEALSKGSAFDDIGNGLYRLNLQTLKNSISLETVNRFFVNTANSVCGTIHCFEEKLSILRQCCEDGQLPFHLKEVDTYLSQYKNKGYPMVSHTDMYRNTYHPSYRIVKSEYCYYLDAFMKIDFLLKSMSTVNIAIDGNSSSGKSTLASLISTVYDCNLFHMDDFFLTPELRTKERLLETGGNVDYVRFKQEVIAGLLSDKNFKYRPYDCAKLALGLPIQVSHKRLNIIEGSYSMHQTLIDHYNLTIFLHIGESEQSNRILKRNGESMHQRFLCEWIPMENQYFKELEIAEKSDLVFRGYQSIESET